jgi:hypothetical protein
VLSSGRSILSATAFVEHIGEYQERLRAGEAEIRSLGSCKSSSRRVLGVGRRASHEERMRAQQC